MNNPEAIGYVVLGVTALLGIISYYHNMIVKPSQEKDAALQKSLNDINMGLTSLSLRFDRSNLDLGELKLQLAETIQRIERIEREFEIASARQTIRTD